ncbi:MAG: hypothetical protein CVV02_07680 [Firmicutes bacterium HGW-Firmicutes-7]|nr:MAG: hypothetical protein CVV02_07680 [Firmicutes bacterium HGW-Firmicutes-7]
MKNHINKVNKIVIKLLFLLANVTALCGVFFKMPILYAVSMIYIVLITLVGISIYKKAFELGSGYVISFVIGIAVLSFINNTNTVYLVLIPISLAGLYLNIKLFIMVSIFMNSILVIKLLLLRIFDDNLVITLMIVNVIILIMFFMTKWGTELIMTISKEAQKASNSLDALVNTMLLIDQNTKRLNLQISNCEVELQLVKEKSSALVETVDSITLEDILTTMEEQDAYINTIYDRMQEITKSCTHLKSVVQTNENNRVGEMLLTKM